MGAVWFYHLTRRPLEATLPMLLDKSRAAGWHVVVRGTDPGRIDWLDEKLWLSPAESFLPHARAGGDFDADQPVLLTAGEEMTNRPACLMAIDGAPVGADEVKALERTCILFDGNDQAALAHARGQWKALTDAGCPAAYWSEESGKWEMKRETG